MANTKADFGKNLRAVRLMAGETLAEVAESVDVAKTTIAMYERGERTPSLDILKALAAHFGISIDYLVRTVDLEDAVPKKNQDNLGENPTAMKDYVEALFPLVLDDQSEGNKTYEEAASLAKDALECFEKHGRVEAERLEKCVILFAKAFKESPEYATCGYIWSILFLWWTGYFEYFKKLQTEKDYSYLRLSDFYKEKSEDYQELKKNALAIQGETMLEFLDYARHTSKLKEIGEYYYALWYLLDLADGGLPADINAVVGAQLMHDQYRLGNPYAQRLLTIENDLR